jgi:hypothetical protein
MKDITRKKIIRALTKYADGVMTFIGRGLLSFDPRAERDFRRAFKMAMRAHLVEIDRLLRTRPEPTPEQLKKLLQKADEPIGEEIGEVEIKAMMRSFLRGWLRKLPPFPPGKPPSLTPQQRKKAISEVRRLVTIGGMARKAAYEKVAKRYGVHWRTIQNLWLKIQKQTQKGGIE